jgi:ribonuclease Z
MLRLTFLGTSAAQPTAHRGLSGLAVRRAGELLLFDCGEGSQRQMIRYGTGFDVGAIFFTHFHADHYLGAIGLLRTLSMQGRAEPLEVYGPAPVAKPLLEKMLFAGVDRLAFPVRITELKDGEKVRREGAEIRAFSVVHRTPAIGFAIVEDGRPGRFHPEKALSLGVPYGPMFGKLQKGESVTVGDRVIRPDEVLDAARAGRKVVLSGDTRPCRQTTAAARGADLLIHEATFSDAEQERAEETMHSTAREAARVAKEAGVKRLVITHLSSRYDVDPSPLTTEAREEFSPVDVAFDGYTVEVPLPPDP